MRAFGGSRSAIAPTTMDGSGAGRLYCLHAGKHCCGDGQGGPLWEPSLTAKGGSPLRDRHSGAGTLARRWWLAGGGACATGEGACATRDEGRDRHPHVVAALLLGAGSALLLAMTAIGVSAPRGEQGVRSFATRRSLQNRGSVVVLLKFQKFTEGELNIVKNLG